MRRSYQAAFSHQENLISAIQSNDLNSIKILLKTQINLNEKTPDGSTVLTIAAKYGRKEIVIALLEAGANPYLKKH